jgi:subtilisin family serine protease
VLDSGVGKHPWMTPDVVTRGLVVNNTSLGMFGADTDVAGGVVDPLQGELGCDTGHGTFVAGLIRQMCPDADVLSIRVMDADGVAEEHILLEALAGLATRQEAGQAPGGDGSGFIDVLSLSLGYYHEQPIDSEYDSQLLDPLLRLARGGTAVVVAAGNDATFRPMYPAAFSPHSGSTATKFDPNCVPVVSVGALNPDGKSTALFSNEGEWVRCMAPGAALVSAFPTNVEGPAQPSYRVAFGTSMRATIDPDNFSSGFATWSGTSFAAPILAGEIAQELLDGVHGDCGPTDAASAVARGWAAFSAKTEVAKP